MKLWPQLWQPPLFLHVFSCHNRGPDSEWKWNYSHFPPGISVTQHLLETAWQIHAWKGRELAATNLLFTHKAFTFSIRSICAFAHLLHPSFLSESKLISQKSWISKQTRTTWTTSGQLPLKFSPPGPPFTASRTCSLMSACAWSAPCGFCFSCSPWGFWWWCAWTGCSFTLSTRMSPSWMRWQRQWSCSPQSPSVISTPSASAGWLATTCTTPGSSLPCSTAGVYDVVVAQWMWSKMFVIYVKL